MNTANQHLRQALSITGMACDGCAAAVTRALSRVAGVETVAVDLASGRAVVEGTAGSEALIGAVKAAGFGAGTRPPQG